MRQGDGFNHGRKQKTRQRKRRTLIRKGLLRDLRRNSSNGIHIDFFGRSIAKKVFVCSKEGGVIAKATVGVYIRCFSASA